MHIASNFIKIMKSLLKNGPKSLKHFKYTNMLKQSPLFDKVYYKSNDENFLSPYVHFLYIGGFTGLNPSKYFDTEFYCKVNPHVTKQNLNPLIHYIMFGRSEGRLPSENFKRQLSPNDNYVCSFDFKDIEQYQKYQQRLKNSPSVSVILNIKSDTELKLLSNTLTSLSIQQYNRFTIFVFSNGDLNEDTTLFINGYKTLLDIKIINSSIEKYIDKIDSEYIISFRVGDMLHQNAIYNMLQCAMQSDCDFIYTDEDKVNSNDKHYDPHYKPDYSYDMFLANNYIGYLAMIKTDVLKILEKPFDINMNDAMLFDTYLKVFEKTDSVYHIQKVLYHKSIFGEVKKIKNSILKCDSKEYTQSIVNHFERIDIDATVSMGKIEGTRKIDYAASDELVSIIIPFKDQPEILKTCIKSILQKTEYANFEIIGVSNNSKDKETFDMMDKLSSLNKRISFHEHNVAFNFSAINNYAAKNFAKGNFFLFLNNDTEIITKGWLTHMMGYATRADIGAVSARLLYPNDTIQSAGIYLNSKKIAQEFHKNFDKNDDGYFSRLQVNQNVSGVSGACLLIEKNKFNIVKGFDETNFKISLNDLDLSLRIQNLGVSNIICSNVDIYHYESLTRPKGDNPLYSHEKQMVQKLYGDQILSGDKYYNQNLTLDYLDFSLK